MTRLEKSVRRAVTSRLGERLVAELRPEGLYIREPGRRIWYGPLDYGYLRTHAARLTADAARKLKRRVA